MSMMKETAIAVPALALLLFVSNHFFGPGETYRQPVAVPTSWLGWAPIPAERFLAKAPVTGRASEANAGFSRVEQTHVRDMTPEARIRSVFAQFGPGARPRTT